MRVSASPPQRAAYRGGDGDTQEEDAGKHSDAQHRALQPRQTIWLGVTVHSRLRSTYRQGGNSM